METTSHETADGQRARSRHAIGGNQAHALFPYQAEGARFLSGKKFALLADQPGLGKTAQAVSACDIVGADSVVVICPASVKETWKREFARFGKRGLVPSVHSYDAASRGALGTALYESHKDVLILDEIHYCKTRTSKRTKAIFGSKCDGLGGLVEKADHVFCLSATPTPNNPSELWPMLRAVMPEAITSTNDKGKMVLPKPLSYWAFIQRYCKTVDKGFGQEIVGGKNLGELKARIAPFVLRRKKDEVLKDLPPIRFDTLPLEGRIDLTPEMEDSAIAIAEALRDDGVEGLAKLAPHVATLRRLTGLAKVSPAVEWIKDWLDAGGKKLVVFAYHREVVDSIFESIALGTGYRSDRLTGSTPGDKRQHIVDRFQNGDSNVFIGQITAAGTGITLTAASDVLFVESSWVPADNEQAAMRIHRIGQKNACLIRFAMLAGSIDEQIQKAVLRKTQDITALFG